MTVACVVVGEDQLAEKRRALGMFAGRARLDGRLHTVAALAQEQPGEELGLEEEKEEGNEIQMNPERGERQDPSRSGPVSSHLRNAYLG